MSDIKLYNTLSRRKELFKPIKKGYVSMYHCGPTVYDTPHIGNYRTFVLDDLIRRVFEFNGYAVDQAMNITDVDDKTIRRSREEGVSLKKLTEKYEKLFFIGIDSLRILRPHHVIRATEYIQQMVALIEELLKKGVAYKSADGIYVSIEEVKNYGELANLDLSQISKERITKDEYDKDNPRDFAVWKFKVPEDGGVSWKTSFGEGRPGWHIECSAMAMDILGETIDIHSGGMDLIFPHHTNEIAQSESATGKPFVHYWIHGGFMTVAEEKMAKSKKNFLKLEDLLAEHVSPLGFRYWLMTAHYRSPINFSIDAVHAAQSALIRLLNIVSEYPEPDAIDPVYSEKFKCAVNDDLNLPQAVAIVWDLIRDPHVTDNDKHATLLHFDAVLGLGLKDVPKSAIEEIPPEIRALSDAREEARKDKDWKKADALRSEIDARGYTLKDTPRGLKIIRK